MIKNRKQHRVLNLLADAPHGRTVANMLAHGVTDAELDRLARDGLATVQPGTIRVGVRRITVEWVEITDAGQRVLALSSKPHMNDMRLRYDQAPTGVVGPSLCRDDVRPAACLSLTTVSGAGSRGKPRRLEKCLSYYGFHIQPNSHWGSISKRRNCRGSPCPKSVRVCHESIDWRR